MVRKLSILAVVGLIAIAGCSTSKNPYTRRVDFSKTEETKIQSSRSKNLSEIRNREDRMIVKAKQMGYSGGTEIYFACQTANTYSYGNLAVKDNKGAEECLIERGYGK